VKARPTTVEGDPKVPERLNPFFKDVELFEKGARLDRRLANIFQQIEQTPAYLKAVERKKHRQHSTYMRSAAREIRSITPKRPCPGCGNSEFEPSLDSEPCAACEGKGYQTRLKIARRGAGGISPPVIDVPGEREGGSEDTAKRRGRRPFRPFRGVWANPPSLPADTALLALGGSLLAKMRVFVRRTRRSQAGRFGFAVGVVRSAG
jgi:hypothetical protein